MNDIVNDKNDHNIVNNIMNYIVNDKRSQFNIINVIVSDILNNKKGHNILNDTMDDIVSDKKPEALPVYLAQVKFFKEYKLCV